LTRAELLENRTDEPALTAEQFAKALRLAVAEFKAERLVRRRRRGRPAKPRDLGLDDAAELYTVADAAELLAGTRA